jgi:hypothetical protein
MSRESYAVWMARLDQVCQARTGLGIDDLPDGCSRDAFEDGMTPEAYLQELLEDNNMEDLC